MDPCITFICSVYTLEFLVQSRRRNEMSVIPQCRVQILNSVGRISKAEELNVIHFQTAVERATNNLHVGT